MNTDSWLANIYGTGGADDLEKTAQYMMLEKLAEEEGVDLSGLDEEQLSALAQEVLSADGAEEDEGTEISEEEQQEYLAKEASAKFEEADFLGRVMAHSYTQELEKIAAEGYREGSRAHAMSGEAAAGAKNYESGKGVSQGKWSPSRLGREALRRGKNLGKGVGHAFSAKGLREGLHKRKSMKSLIHKAVTKGDEALAGRAHHAKGLATRMALKGGAKTVGAYGAAAGGLGLAAHHFKHKEASAFEKMAEERAAEILAANGVDPSTGAPAEEQFGEALDSRALEILQENGYDVSGIVGE